MHLTTSPCAQALYAVYNTAQTNTQAVKLVRPTAADTGLAEMCTREGQEHCKTQAQQQVGVEALLWTKHTEQTIVHGPCHMLDWHLVGIAASMGLRPNSMLVRCVCTMIL